MCGAVQPAVLFTTSSVSTTGEALLLTQNTKYPPATYAEFLRQRYGNMDVVQTSVLTTKAALTGALGHNIVKFTLNRGEEIHKVGFSYAWQIPSLLKGGVLFADIIDQGYLGFFGSDRAPYKFGSYTEHVLNATPNQGKFIFDRWLDRLKDPPRYLFVHNNCASVVYDDLKAAGLMKDVLSLGAVPKVLEKELDNDYLQFKGKGLVAFKVDYHYENVPGGKPRLVESIEQPGSTEQLKDLFLGAGKSNIGGIEWRLPKGYQDPNLRNYNIGGTNYKKVGILTTATYEGDSTHINFSDLDSAYLKDKGQHFITFLQDAIGGLIAVHSFYNAVTRNYENLGVYKFNKKGDGISAIISKSTDKLNDNGAKQYATRILERISSGEPQRTMFDQIPSFSYDKEYDYAVTINNSTGEVVNIERTPRSPYK